MRKAQKGFGFRVEKGRRNEEQRKGKALHRKCHSFTLHAFVATDGTIRMIGTGLDVGFCWNNMKT